MANGATKQYKFGTKNNWRRQMWNQFRARLRNPKLAKGLYLAGPENLDLSIAVSKGFDPRNLVAVEKDQAAVEQLRASGQLVIKGDFAEVLLSWPADIPLDFVYGDFCSGLTRDLDARLGCAWHRAPFRNAVWGLNFLHGRESGVQHWLEFHKDERQVLDRHRGVIFLCNRFAIGPSEELSVVTGTTEQVREAIRESLREAHHRMMPWVRRYKSDVGNLYFDSIVVNRAAPTDVCPKLDAMLMGEVDAGLRRRIAAALALRTMKHRQVGPYADRRAA
jgi:hypothetical protein